ncbi:MAG: hypothetical protein E6J83_09160 [Deltaproteobacteria bacterium]|nr:MAG: hypothetical protein E6J83_09160 [Deltaproteobacteria bacterium]TMA56336.1 MAG: hypothetical protein E6J75_09895 [Deltaproteobacteria bacterium]
MPEVRAALRGSRLAAVLVGVAVLLATQLALSTVGRLRGGTHELRWLRARLAEGGDHLDRQRRENAELIGAVDRLVHVTEVLHNRAAEARRSVQMEESREPLGEPLVQPVSLAAGAVFVSDDAARAIGELAWVGGQLAAAGDSLAILTALEKQRSEDVAIGSPSLWPIRGLVTSTFGPRLSPYGGGREMHPGIDIQAAYGEPVAAGGSGEVIYAGREPGYGRLVIVDHGRDVETFYGHLSKIFVREGQRISRGQDVGAIGASGRATGAHLHYEVRVNNEPVNPRRYLLD